MPLRALLLLLPLAVAGCGSTPPADSLRPRTDAHGLTAYYVEEVTLEQFFQSHRCMVTAVHEVKPATGGWSVQTVYPSTNWSTAGGVGDSIQYPHEVTVTNPRAVPVDPMRIDRESTLLVLVQTAADHFAYELLGTAKTQQNDLMSWFRDRKEYWFRPQ